MQADLHEQDGNFTATITEFSKKKGNPSDFVTFTIEAENNTMEFFTHKEHLHILKEAIEQFEEETKNG